MKAGTLLRIGINVVGLWSLLSGLTSSVYYLHDFISGVTTDLGGRPIFGALIFGHTVTPLLFALFCFGFAQKLTRFLLGAAADEAVAGISAKEAANVLLKVLALYVLALYGPPLIATFFELIAIRSGNTQLSEVQVMSELISNGLGVALGLWLGLRTSHALAIFIPSENT